MKNILLLSITLFSLSSVFGQWLQLNSGTTENLNCVYFTDENTGYAAGSGLTSATLIKTIDGGATWTPIVSGTIYEIVSIFFTNSNTGFYLNSNNELYKTTDAGNSWTFMRNFWGYSGKIHFTNEQVGYLGLSDGNRGLFYKTIDGGNIWLDSIPVLGMSNVTALHFVNSMTGYAVSFGGKVAKTIDAGESWFELTQPTAMPLLDVFFTTSDIGYAVGGDGTNNLVLRTIDGGDSWTLQTIPPSSSLNAVFFTSSETGYIGTSSIFQTNNSGTNWTSMTSPSSEITDLYFPSNSVGYAVGYGGVILKIDLLTTSIPESLNFEVVKTYPNPAMKDIKLSEETSGMAFQITNTIGQVFLKGVVNNNSINVDDLRSGTYFLKLSNNYGQSQIIKFIKQ